MPNYRSVQAREDGLSYLEARKEHTYSHTLSVRMSEEQYRRLRRFVTRHEDRTGRRITHQAVLEGALNEYLDRNTTPRS